MSKLCVNCGTINDDILEECKSCGSKLPKSGNNINIDENSNTAQVERQYTASTINSYKNEDNIKPINSDFLLALTAFIFIGIGITMIIIGLVYKIPSSYINFESIEEYVGGDAYNLIIESSIRGNEIAAARLSKLIILISGIFFTLFGIFTAGILKLLQKN